MWRMCLLVTCNLYHKLPINFWTTEQKGEFTMSVEGLPGEAWPGITALRRASSCCSPYLSRIRSSQLPLLTNRSKTPLSLKEPVLHTSLGEMPQRWWTGGDIALQKWPDITQVRSEEDTWGMQGSSHATGQKNWEGEWRPLPHITKNMNSAEPDGEHLHPPQMLSCIHKIVS